MTTGLSNRVNESNAKWFTLAAACIALFMAIMDNLILNVAIPTISSDLNPSTVQLQWIISAYTLVFASLQITAGGLGDRLGRKRLFQFGVVVFTVTSLFAGLVDSNGLLIAARAVMGFGAAFIMPLSLSIISHAFPPEERGRAIGIWSAVSMSGLALGPVVGGVVVEYLSWHWIFLINVPIGLLCFFVTAAVVRESRDESGSAATDIPGTVLVTLGIAALTWGLIEAGERGWSEGLVLSAFAAAIIFLVAFVFVELRTENPMIPMDFFKSRTFSGTNLDAFITAIFISGLAFSMTMYWQNIHGYSPIRAGFTNIPFVIVMMFTAPLSGSLVNKVGARRLISLGLVIAGVSAFMFAQVEAGTRFLAVVPAMLVMGAGMGLIMAPMTTAMMNSVPTRRAGVASAVNGAVRETGFAFGIALLGSIISQRYRSDFESNSTIRETANSSPDMAALLHAIGDRVTAAGKLIQDEDRFPGIPEEIRNMIQDVSSNAFVNGFHLSFWITGALCLACAVISFLVIDDKVAEERKVEEGDEGEHFAVAH